MGLISSLFKGKDPVITKARPLPRTSPSEELRINQTLGMRGLESMPVQAAKAFQLACDPKATLNDFVTVVESDEILSARIIKVANSVYYRRGEEAKDISCAVANIGLDELRCLLSAAMLRSLLKTKSKARNQIWGNSVATAITARHLSSFTEINEGEAFLAGILHDVGKLIFVQRITPEYQKIVNEVNQTGKSFIELEMEKLDLTHVEVGKWLAEKWNFPESVRRAITFHHNSWPSNETLMGKQTSTAMLIKCANTIAHAGRLGHPHELTKSGANAKEELIAVAEQLKKPISTIEAILSQVEKQFNDEFSIYSAE